MLVDAIVRACADSTKQFMHSSVLALTHVRDTAVAVLGDVHKVSGVVYGLDEGTVGVQATTTHHARASLVRTVL